MPKSSTFLSYYLLKRFHQLVSKHFGRKLVFAQSSGVTPRLQLNLPVDCSDKAVTPLDAGEMIRDIFNGRGVNTFRVSTSVV